jgi:protein involved in polysaccharide export with SLBB domain
MISMTGCYDPEQVKAFIEKDRPPVSGVEYVVFPPDSITITSRRVPEINGIQTQVRPDGKINLPLLGEIYVAGKTPSQIEQAMIDAASEYYEEVDVTVQVTGYNSQNFYVFGQVQSPGPMPWTGRDSLLEVMARAQPTFLAWPERIIVVRPDSPQVGGREVAPPRNEDEKYTFQKTGVSPPQPGVARTKMIFNLWAMVKEGDMTHNILLMPNDIIYVQANPFGKVGLALKLVLYPVQPILETVRVPSTLENATSSGQDD